MYKERHHFRSSVLFLIFFLRYCCHRRSKRAMWRCGSSFNQLSNAWRSFWNVSKTFFWNAQYVWKWCTSSNSFTDACGETSGTFCAFYVFAKHVLTHSWASKYIVSRLQQSEWSIILAWAVSPHESASPSLQSSFPLASFGHLRSPKEYCTSAADTDRVLGRSRLEKRSSGILARSVSAAE